MASLSFQEKDLQKFKNLVVMLKKAKFDGIEGLEVLGFAQTYSWVVSLMTDLQTALKPIEESITKVENKKPRKKKRKKRK